MFNLKNIYEKSSELAEFINYNLIGYFWYTHKGIKGVIAGFSPAQFQQGSPNSRP